MHCRCYCRWHCIASGAAGGLQVILHCMWFAADTALQMVLQVVVKKVVCTDWRGRRSMHCMSFCIALYCCCSANFQLCVKLSHFWAAQYNAWPDLLYCLYLPRVACLLSGDTCLPHLVPPPYLASKYEPENDFLKSSFCALFNITVHWMLNILFGGNISTITTKEWNFGSSNDRLYYIQL